MAQGSPVGSSGQATFVQTEEAFGWLVLATAAEAAEPGAQGGGVGCLSADPCDVEPHHPHGS